NSIERNKGWLKQWRYSRAVMLPHPGEAREAPEAGEIFRQADLAATLRKLVDAEQQALRQGKSRRDAIMAAYARFYTGDIAQEFVRGLREEGGLVTLADLAAWKVKLGEPGRRSRSGACFPRNTRGSGRASSIPTATIRASSRGTPIPSREGRIRTWTCFAAGPRRRALQRHRVEGARRSGGSWRAPRWRRS